MASLYTVGKSWVLAVTIVCMSIFWFHLARLMKICLKQAVLVMIQLKFCEESSRLSASGNLDVPPEYTDEYCSGPCLSETHLVLNCIENIMKNFVFYNKATIHDIRDTIKAGCSYGPERGNFDVEEHLEAEESGSNKATASILFGVGSIITGLTPFL
ncbi:hypothetical protein CXB51_025586 [Gossypium anomalum]|uniref:DUF7731 domain-containing protein n=1 Tax=Gossypium anomalum TaxID=47600 RepID=A0A8J5Y1Y1_9ROSI|nr:hypothetical protein CXB51_025586 [Gossypium anomalum]